MATNQMSILLLYVLVNLLHQTLASNNELLSCGKHTIRDLNSSRIINGKIYDSITTLAEGLDGKVEKAFSIELGQCVALKTCVEDPRRLAKCSREVEVLKLFRNSTNIVKLLDYEIKQNQTCTEGAIMSDSIRLFVIGSDKKRRKRQTAEEEEMDTDKNETSKGDNCNEVVIVEELGMEPVESYWRKTKNGTRNESMLGHEEIKKQIIKAMEELHEKGISHRDFTRENSMLFPLLSEVATASNASASKMVVKLIDLGWACCFDVAKCGLKVSNMLAECSEHQALGDDQLSLQDVLRELDGM